MSKKQAELTSMGEVLMRAVGLPDPADIVTAEEAVKAVQRFKELEAAMDAYGKIFKQKVFKIADAYGVRDEKGNVTVTLADGTGYKKELRQTVSIDHEKAVELFRAKGLEDKVTTGYSLLKGYTAKEVLAKAAPYLPEHLRDTYFESFDTVPDQAIEEAFMNGVISDAELKSTISKKIVEALKEIKPK